MPAKCPAANTASVEQEKFWDGHFDAHKIGWLIAGSAAAVTCIISLASIMGHALHYNKRLQQRQIIRILLFAPVFAVVSFFSYRFFRKYTYYELVEVVWEAVAIAAFLMLLLQYIGESIEAQVQVFVKKDKTKLPLPFCCFRYRPSKAYFLFILKWSVLQYVLVRPALSVAGIILEYYEILCNQSLSPSYGHVYLLAIDFVSISVALYGLIVLYGLVREELKGRRPLSKFMTIKLAIFFTFYQSFVFSILQDHGVIKGTEYWTSQNVSDGLNALCVTLEMVLVAIWQAFAFPWTEYRLRNLEDDEGPKGERANAKGRTNPFWAILDALNLWDFAVEFGRSLRFAFARIRGKEWTRQDARQGNFDFLIFQGGYKGVDSPHEKAASSLHRSEMQVSARSTEVGAGEQLPLQPLQQHDSRHSAPESTRSQAILLPGNGPAPPPMPTAAPSNLAANPAGDASAHGQNARGERPLSWEPQAV